MLIYEVENYSQGFVVETFSNEEEAEKFAEKMTRETGYTHIATPKEMRYEV